MTEEVKDNGQGALQGVAAGAFRPTAREFADNSDGAGTALAKSGVHLAQTVEKIMGLCSTVVGGTVGWLDHEAQKIAQLLGTELLKKVEKVPEDRRIEPVLNLVGPALEETKYRINEPDIREAILNLISSSMDSELVQYCHPSYPHIVNQLSGDEAKLLKLLSSYKMIGYCVQVRLNTAWGAAIQEEGGDLKLNGARGRATFTLAIPPDMGLNASSFDNTNYHEHMGLDNPDLWLSSINNLIRLGLLKNLHRIQRSGHSPYKIYPINKKQKDVYDKGERILYEALSKVGRQDEHDDFFRHMFSFSANAWGLTSAGADFVRACFTERD